MKVLILGGTVFLSRAVAREFVTRGHDVTCLSRSIDAHDLGGVRAVSADRTRGVGAYDDVRGPWDAVVDVATDPRRVRDALTVLAATSRHWTYVSSCSVYADQDEPGADESCALCEALPIDQDSTLENYGSSKAACERLCLESLGERLFVVRPGLIVGPSDPSDRGGYWCARFARDDDVIVPRGQGLVTQIIDVSDLASWIVASSEERLVGAFNAVGPARPLGEVLIEARSVSRHRGALHEADDQWLLDHGVQPWSGTDSLPLWIPRGLGYDGFTRRSNTAAISQGLVLRPTRATFDETLVDEVSRGLGRERAAGLSPRRERELLAALASDSAS